MPLGVDSTRQAQDKRANDTRVSPALFHAGCSFILSIMDLVGPWVYPSTETNLSPSKKGATQAALLQVGRCGGPREPFP